MRQDISNEELAAYLRKRAQELSKLGFDTQSELFRLAADRLEEPARSRAQKGEEE